MKFTSAIVFLLAFLLFNHADAMTKKRENVVIVMPKPANNRIQYGVEKLAQTLRNASFTVQIISQNELPKIGKLIIVGTAKSGLVRKANSTYHLVQNKLPGKEGFSINTFQTRNFLISGTDFSGTLYGCLELADRIRSNGKLPPKISVTDQPEMVQRGACIGIQKPALLPGRGVYEYPYTPESFPWFYDKALWIRYLDMLAEDRMNSMYLWNGHPFASLVRVKEYPYAVEVDSATFKKNEEIYRFLTKEADRRGIWVIQGFYNIIIPNPLAEKYHLKTQDRNRPIIPLIADYTRKSIAAFVEKYPNVGLLITLGEAMESAGPDDVDWFTKTIIPGVKDGLKALGKTEEPPIVLRAHDTDAPMDMRAALPLYHNLYTMAKYNGEALTTYTPRGSWAALHRTLSGLGSVQIENVHIMANLEPFRYGSDDFIQKCVQAMHSVYHANGLHLYPQASYWDWPYSADKVSPRELQIDRDWIWYAEWSRYAWKVNRKREDEIIYWADQLAKRYGCSLAEGKNILEAYEQAGEIEPKLLRRFGITDGNRQTLTLGMFMSQLINPKKYGLFTLLYESEAPPGEMLIDYAQKEALKEAHTGETPPVVIAAVTANGENAVQAIDKASPSITKNKAEFLRLKNDMYCQKALADFYAEKAKAAMLVLRYKYSDDLNDLEKAVPFLQKSVDYFQQLTNLTKDNYLYANSMQTQQRKIPIGGNDGKNKTWAELLPYYQKEMENFKKNIQSLKEHQNNVSAGAKPQVLNNADHVTANYRENLLLKKGEQVFSDTTSTIKDFAPVLSGLKGIKFSRSAQISNGTTLEFENKESVKLLVGYFIKKDNRYLKEPELETDANANNFGQSETKIANAMLIDGFPTVNVHSFSFPPGKHNLNLGKGICLVLGFIDGKQEIKPFDAGLGAEGNNKDLDWLFN